MVLELKAPQGTEPWELRPLVPALLSYVLSFVFIGIYWNNHHHLLHTIQRVNGRVLWANLHLLFWLSLIPVTTGWLGAHHHAPWPTALYGAVLLMAGLAYLMLARALIASGGGPDSPLAKAMGADVKGKLSLALYLSATVLSFVRPWMAQALYVLVALIWLIPEPRIERQVER
jgi:uncharacterized membrane protein